MNNIINYGSQKIDNNDINSVVDSLKKKTSYDRTNNKFV